MNGNIEVFIPEKITDLMLRYFRSISYEVEVRKLDKSFMLTSQAMRELHLNKKDIVALELSFLPDVFSIQKHWV